jgi:hypothetical protein
MDNAMKMLAQAQLNGLDRQLSITRIVMELYLYNQNATASANTAFQALQIDSEEMCARYFAADALSQLNHPEASAVIARAQMELDDMQARLYAMAGGLFCLAGDYVNATAQLGFLAGKRDMEALSLVKHDPAWHAVRNATPSDSAELQKAHAAYTKVFAF